MLDHIRFVLPACAVASAASAQVPQNWQIALVARSSLNPAIAAFRLPFPSSLSSQPVALDESGGVAFRAVLGSSPTEGIFYGDPSGGGLVVTATNTNDPVFSPTLDAFGGRIAVADAVFGGDGATVYDTSGNVEQRYDPGGSLAVSGISGPTLSLDGAIAYRADFGFVGDRIAVDEFVGGVRTQTPVADTFSGVYSFLLTPRMNANRQVVANTIPNVGPSRRIVRFDPVSGAYAPFTVVETGPIYDSFVNSTGIGTDGSVSFTGRRSSDGVREVVLASPSGSLTTIAEGGQGTISNSNLANFPPVNNANGLVAFRVEDGSGSTALYVGDGTDLVRIVKSGDLLDTDLGPIAAGFNFGGTTGVQTINSNIDINDRNQIAFGAFLENGTIGIFIATPEATGGPCNPADLAAPLGQLTFADIGAFVAAFDAGSRDADLAAPFGQLTFADIGAFVAAFNAGCP
jgi:hypothetical protein